MHPILRARIGPPGSALLPNEEQQQKLSRLDVMEADEIMKRANSSESISIGAGAATA